MLGCSLACLLFHVTIIISLHFMLPFITFYFYSALYRAHLLRVFNKNIQHSVFRAQHNKTTSLAFQSNQSIALDIKLKIYTVLFNIA